MNDDLDISMPEDDAPLASTVQDDVRNRVELHFAIRDYEYALSLYQSLMRVFLALYNGEPLDLPHDEFKRKTASDVLLAQEALRSLVKRGETLASLARKLESYIPSGKIVI